jgi:hypothetical protein
MITKSLDDWSWPETGPCDKCYRPGRYVGGYVHRDGYEVLNFLCTACEVSVF